MVMSSQVVDADILPLKTVAKRRCPHLQINKQLIPVKILYFLQLAGVASLLLYVVMFMQSRLNLTKPEIAITSFIAPFVGFLARPMGGAIADRFQTFRLILAILLVCSCASFSFMLCIPRISDDNSTSTDNSTASDVDTTVSVPWSANFIPALILRSLGYFFFTPILCLADAITLAILGDAERTEFGITRAFGSLGFFVFSLITSGLVKISPDTFLPPFLLFGIVMAASLFVLIPLKVPKDIQCSHSLWEATKMVCRSSEMIVLFLFATLSGTCLSVLEHYVFVAVEQLVNPEGFYYGLMTAAMVFSETPVIAASAFFIDRIGGTNCICLGFVFWAIRFTVYSVMNHVWQVLLNELLHGLTFGLIVPAMITEASRLAPRGAEGTVQGLLSGVHFGLGVAIGGLLGGVLVDWLGYRRFFRVAAVYSLVCCITLFIIHRAMVWRKRKRLQRERSDPEEEVRVSFAEIADNAA